MSEGDDATTTMTHVAGVCIQYGTHQRQRCSWCGYVLVDDDLSRMAVAITEEDPHPRAPSGFPFETLVRVTSAGGFRGSSVLEDLETHDDGSIKVPEDCCLRLPPELTGRQP